MKLDLALTAVLVIFTFVAIADVILIFAWLGVEIVRAVFGV